MRQRAQPTSRASLRRKSVWVREMYPIATAMIAFSRTHSSNLVKRRYCSNCELVNEIRSRVKISGESGIEIDQTATFAIGLVFLLYQTVNGSRLALAHPGKTLFVPKIPPESRFQIK